MSKKHNQAKNRAIKSHGQTDEEQNIQVAQMLRNLYPNIKIYREWFILFKPDGTFYRVQEKEPIPCSSGIKYRHPDFMVFEKGINNTRSRLLCCMENDGNIHRIKWADTDDRNKQYDTAKIPLLVITKERVSVSIFDEANKLLGEFLNNAESN